MRKLVILISTGLGTGFSPKAPGTVGTMLGVLLALFFPMTWWQIIVLALIGTWAAQQGEKVFNEKDSQKIVIDEIIGYFIAIQGLGNYYIIPAFVLFRFFDIKKPGPIRKLQDFHGGLGVMADDILAGLITNLILKIISVIL